MTRASRHLTLFLFSLFLVLEFHSLFAQYSQPNRFEKEYKFRDEDFVVISLETEGIALLREKNKIKSGNQYWEAFLLDSALQEKKFVEFEVDTRNELTGFEYSPGLLSLIYIRKESKGIMSLVSLDLKSGEAQHYEIKPQLNFMLTQFCAVGENFAFGGYVNMEPAVLLYTPATNNIKMVPGFFTKNTEIIDMRANQNQTFNTLLLEKGDRDTRKIIFRTFDTNGKLLLDNAIPIDEEITLQNGITSTLIRDDLMILGTWGKRNTKQALGFYTLPVNPFGEQKINRKYFGQLSHYLDYLKPKKAAKIKNRTLKAVKNGKLPDFTNYVMPFRILEQDKGFILLAESYIPGRTDTPYSPTTSPYNNYSSPYYTPYSGYSQPNIYKPYYTYGTNVSNEEKGKNVQGAIMAFDGGGDLLWDYSIKLEDIKKAALEQTVDFYLDDQSLHLVYKKESELRIKKIDFSTDQATDYSEKIILTNVSDEVRSENDDAGEVRNWFGKNFYVWGYQSIRSKNNVYKTRDVFYINKVVIN